MKKSHHNLLVGTIISIAATLTSVSAMAVDAPAREATCRACHGAQGAAPIASAYPKLKGQNKDYLVSALKAYRNKERTSALAAMMAAQAMTLNEADIEALANYYSAQ